MFLSLTSRSLSVNKWAPPGCAICLSRNFMSCLLFWTLLLMSSILGFSGVTSSGASCHIICFWLISELFWICPFLAWVWQHWTGNTIQAEGAGLIEVSGAEFGGLRRGWKGCCTVCWKKREKLKLGTYQKTLLNKNILWTQENYKIKITII